MLARIVQRLEMSRVDREAREHEQSSGYDSEERTAAFVAHELRREGGVFRECSRLLVLPFTFLRLGLEVVKRVVSAVPGPN